MYIETLKIKGYRIFDSEFTVKLSKGLNILVGENASGKSTIVDAIRLLLLEDEYGRAGIESSDFHRPIAEPTKSKGSDRIALRCEFADLSADEQVAYLPWLDLNNPTKSILNLAIENKEDSRGKFKRKIWGNESETGLFEWELLSKIHCVYLPPLRDAEEKLKAYKGSRVARLLKNLRTDDGSTDHPLEKKFAALNKDLLRDESIIEANRFIKDNIVKSVGAVFGQDVSLQFSEANFDRIVERIRLLFYPILPGAGQSTGLEMFRALHENSLGFNNILYLATVLAEFDGLSADDGFHKVLLIEEPEAHLHPQLQLRLMQYLEEKSRESKIQIIVTTHSPTLASCIDLETVKVMTVLIGVNNPTFTALADCHLGDNKDFIQRWLDITKSVVLFAKGILFVEGIAEALVIKELAKVALREIAAIDQTRQYHPNLEEYGISIINLNGIYFKQFLPLFKGYYKKPDDTFEPCAGIPVRCAGITDNDPESGDKPIPGTPALGKNSQLYLLGELLAQSQNCRMFSNLKTFEYDLAMAGNNLALMSSVYLELLDTSGTLRTTAEGYASTNWLTKTPQELADASYWLLIHIEKIKGEFAQVLAKKISEGQAISVPTYIKDAIKWLVS